jgi:Fe-S-cluster-containing dehydrogenase component
MAINQMVIDLSRCVGCGTCAISCKLGNNTQIKDLGQSFNWADFLTKDPTTVNNKWMAIPVKCNHCVNPLCVDACPVAPVTDATCVGGKRKAMYKLTDANGGLVLHDDSRCIGCQRCQRACKYSVVNLGATNPNTQWSAISFNGNTTQSEWNSDRAVLSGVTSSTAEVCATAGSTSPYRTAWSPEAGASTVGAYGGENVRPANVVEKCYGCFHRTLATEKKLPYCVQACPADARRIVVGTDTFLDDEGNSYTGNSGKTWNTLPSGLKVLAAGSTSTVNLVTPPTTGNQPQTYYKGTFNK